MKLTFVISGILKVLAVLCLLSPSLYAQSGDYMEDFELPDTRTGEVVHLSDYHESPAIVVMFTSSDCAFSMKYQDRINSIKNTYSQKGVVFIAINSNDSTLNLGDAPKRMRVQAPYQFPYLKDENQTVAERFSASRNPEVFVLRPVATQRYEIVYQGQIDDNPLDPKLVEKHYLKNALDAVLQDKQPAVKQTEPTGCNIKWKKS